MKKHTPLRCQVPSGIAESDHIVTKKKHAKEQDDEIHFQNMGAKRIAKNTEALKLH